MIKATKNHLARFALALAMISTLTACVTPQVYSSSQHQAISLQSGHLEQYGLALITPSTITGLEQDKQSLALAFSDVLAQKRPGIRQVPLSRTLGAINQNGIADEYRRMYDDYRDTGIFRKETLEKISSVSGARYLAQLKLASFDQGTQGRWGALGVRLIETKYARIRLFMQIWDGMDGAIAWEGVHELNYAYDTSSEETVTFRTVVEEAAQELIARLP